MSQLGVHVFGAHVLALVVSKDFLFLKLCRDIIVIFLNWCWLSIVNVDSRRHGGQCDCVSCLFVLL